jgi:diaminopimelate epimerase
MQLRFSKMHGLGNDFVVIDAIHQAVSLSAEQVRRFASRRFGIGCDQVLLVEPPDQPEVDFSYRIFNADGSEVAQCGNGARCFARFVRIHGLSVKNVLEVSTLAGRIQLFIEPGQQVRVNMGVPQWDPAHIPFFAPDRAASYDLELGGEHVSIAAVSIGNPHAVLQVADVLQAPVERLGPIIERHPRFPQRVNVGFMQILNGARIRLRVFERGAGETLACGSGACAAVAVGRQLGLLDEDVDVELAAGALQIRWEGGAHPVWMTGPAEHVFDGRIEL